MGKPCSLPYHFFAPVSDNLVDNHAENEQFLEVSVISMREMGAAATTLTEVVQLLQLYPVMPASVATAERSFSTLLIHSKSDKKRYLQTIIVVSFRGLRPGPD